MNERKHLRKHQLYGHLPPITKTIQIIRTRHPGNCWRSKDELISDVLLWTSIYGRAKAGRPARTYIQQLCEDTGCSPEDLPEAMNDKEKWRERVRDIRACGTTWWWWRCKQNPPGFEPEMLNPFAMMLTPMLNVPPQLVPCNRIQSVLFYEEMELELRCMYLTDHSTTTRGHTRSILSAIQLV